MFSNKLDFYKGKPCKWLEFYLDVFWPVLILIDLLLIIYAAVGWTHISVAIIATYIWLLVGHLAGTLFTRFLDKSAFVWWIIANVWPILCNAGMILMLGASVFGQTMDLANTHGTGGISWGGLLGDTASLAGNILSSAIYTGVSMANIVNSAILLIINCVYIYRRKDLFFTPEEKLIHPDDYDD